MLGSVRYINTLLKYSLLHYIVELYPYIFKLLMFTLIHHIAEIYTILLHCWATPYPSTMSNYGLS